jgi:hypothetical protein
VHVVENNGALARRGGGSSGFLGGFGGSLGSSGDRGGRGGLVGSSGGSGGRGGSGVFGGSFASPAPSRLSACAVESVLLSSSHRMIELQDSVFAENGIGNIAITSSMKARAFESASKGVPHQ